MFKFARYSSSVRIFFCAVGQSIHALAVLAMIASIAILLFGSAMYFAEYSPTDLARQAEHDLQRCGSKQLAPVVSEI